MGWHDDWPRLLAAALLTLGLPPLAEAQLALPSAPQMQRLPSPGADAARRSAPAGADTTQPLAATPQAQIDRQKQINAGLKLALKAASDGLSHFRATPYWDNQRDYCLGQSYSFDRVSGQIYACIGQRCDYTWQSSRNQVTTCDPARRGPPICNTSDWCQPGFSCDTSPAPGVCIANDCGPNMSRDDCQPRMDRVRHGGLQ